MTGWTRGCQDKEEEGGGDKQQRAGISPETTEPAQQQRRRNLRMERGGRLLPRREDALCTERLRKSTVQQNQVSTTQI